MSSIVRDCCSRLDGVWALAYWRRQVVSRIIVEFSSRNLNTTEKKALRKGRRVTNTFGVSHMSIKCDELTWGAVVECIRLFNTIGCGSGKWSKCTARRRHCCRCRGCCAMFEARGTVDMFEISHYECLFLFGTKNFRLMRMTSFRDRVFSHRVHLRNRKNTTMIKIFRFERVIDKVHASVCLKE